MRVLLDELVTVDRNLTFQQHIAASGLAVVVVHAVTNRLPDLLPLGPRVVAAIAETPAGAIAQPLRKGPRAVAS